MSKGKRQRNAGIPQSSTRTSLRICLIPQDGEQGKLDLAVGLSQSGSSDMCEYSLHNVRSRPAKVGDKLTTRDFGTGTRGFAASEDANLAVCVLPEARCPCWRGCVLTRRTVGLAREGHQAQDRHLSANQQKTGGGPVKCAGICRDGQIVALTFLCEGQQATVLQLPAEPKTVVELRPSGGQHTRADPGNMVKHGRSACRVVASPVWASARKSSPWRDLAGDGELGRLPCSLRRPTSRESHGGLFKSEVEHEYRRPHFDPLSRVHGRTNRGSRGERWRPRAPRAAGGDSAAVESMQTAASLGILWQSKTHSKIGNPDKMPLAKPRQTAWTRGRSL